MIVYMSKCESTYYLLKITTHIKFAKIFIESLSYLAYLSASASLLEKFLKAEKTKRQCGCR